MHLDQWLACKNIWWIISFFILISCLLDIIVFIFIRVKECMPWWVSNFAFFSHPAWPSVSICLPFWLYTALHRLSIWWKIWLLLLCNHHIMAGGNISVHLVFAPALWEDHYQLELFCKLAIIWYTFTFDIKCILTECSLS